MNGPEEKHNFVSRGTLHKGLCYIANEEKLLRVQIHGSNLNERSTFPGNIGLSTL